MQICGALACVGSKRRPTTVWVWAATARSAGVPRVHTRETIRRVAPVARRPEQSVSVDTSEPDSLRDLHTAIGAQAVGRLMQSLSRPETGHAAPSRVVGPGLQRGEHRAQTRIGPPGAEDR